MNPETKSLLTTIVGYAAAALATWAVSRGIIPGAEAGDFSNVIVAVVLGGGAALIAEYKRRMNTQAAMTTTLAATKDGQAAMMGAINDSTNGAKVVENTAPGTPIYAPPKFVPPTPQK